MLLHVGLFLSRHLAGIPTQTPGLAQPFLRPLAVAANDVIQDGRAIGRGSASRSASAAPQAAQQTAQITPTGAWAIVVALQRTP